jgi:hypothetical protein
VLDQTQLIEHARHRGGDLGLRRVVRQSQPGGVGQRLVDAQLAVDDLVLREVADVGQATGDRLAADGDAALRGGCHAGQRLDERRLPRAALADDRHELAGLDAQRGRSQDLLVLDAHGDALGVEAQRAALLAGDEAAAVEQQPVGPDADLRARGQDRMRGGVAVDARAVARPEVVQRHALAVAHDLGVEARHVGIVEDHVVGRVPADGQAVQREVDEVGLQERRQLGAVRRLLAADEAQRLAADRDGVAVGQPARLATEPLAVELRPVARLQVGDPVAAGHRRDPRVAARDRVPRDDEVVAGLAPDRESLVTDVDAPSLEQHGRRPTTPARRVGAGFRGRWHRRAGVLGVRDVRSRQPAGIVTRRHGGPPGRSRTGLPLRSRNAMVSRVAVTRTRA